MIQSVSQSVSQLNVCSDEKEDLDPEGPFFCLAYLLAVIKRSQRQ